MNWPFKAGVTVYIYFTCFNITNAYILPTIHFIYRFRTTPRISMDYFPKQYSPTSFSNGGAECVLVW